MNTLLDFAPNDPSGRVGSVRLVEVFSAIQGEGLNVGTRQLFIRLAGCDLRCHYCDSAHTWMAADSCRIECTPGDRDFVVWPNPVSMTQLLQAVEQLDHPGLHDSISLTGGEPLLQANFLREFLPRLRTTTQLPLYLETGGHRPQVLPDLLPALDLIGMDIKLPSVSGECHWAAHQAFLQRCVEFQTQVFVKLIISAQTNEWELQKTADLIAEVDRQIPLFLQPVTALEVPHHGQILPPSPQQVLQWQTLLKRSLSQVRVIPQTHKMLNQL